MSIRYCRFDEDGDVIADRKLTTIKEVADILSTATYFDWLEDLGQPMCSADCLLWKKMGEFLKAVTSPKKISLPSASMNADPKPRRLARDYLAAVEKVFLALDRAKKLRAALCRELAENKNENLKSNLARTTEPVP